MNLKRIIREELSDLSDSFYLLVSDDEKFIYGMGKFSGNSFEPVENFDAEAILRSRFRTEDDALEKISWAEYYKGGGGSADRMLKHNPKVVPVDFILRKRDESFPIIESNELDWIKDVDFFVPFESAKYGKIYKAKIINERLSDDISENCGLSYFDIDEDYFVWVERELKNVESQDIFCDNQHYEVIEPALHLFFYSSKTGNYIDDCWMTENIVKLYPTDVKPNYKKGNLVLKESNELDWVRDVEPMSGGEYFNDSKEICFGDNQRHCDVRINNKYITFYFDESDFSDIWDDFGQFDDEWPIIQPIIQNGVPYDGDGDWHEFDSDEFNYSYSHFEQDQLNRLNEILKTVGSDKDVGEFQDSMNSLIREFKYPKLQSLYDGLIGDYLNELGYMVQANRWISVSRAWQDVIDNTGVSVRIDNMGDIVIQIPLEVAYQKYYNTSKVNNLTDLMKDVIRQLNHISWYDWFYDEWDTSGGGERIDNVIYDFLDKAENYLESEDFEKWEKVLSDFEKLGIGTVSSYWYNFNQFQRENPNQDTLWLISFKDNFNKADLKLYKKQNSSYYGTEETLEKHNDVPVEEIPKYIKPLD